MDLYSIPFFNVVRSRMNWLEQRQDVIAENIANSATPGFEASDLKAADFGAVLKNQMAGASMLVSDNPMHMQGTLSRAGGFKTIKTPDRESSPDGNTVVLEDEMMKLSDTQMQHETATGLYRKAVEMLRIAIRGG